MMFAGLHIDDEDGRCGMVASVVHEEDVANSVTARYAYIHRFKSAWKHDTDYNPSSTSPVNTASCMSSSGPPV